MKTTEVLITIKVKNMKKLIMKVWNQDTIEPYFFYHFDASMLCFIKEALELTLFINGRCVLTVSDIPHNAYTYIHTESDSLILITKDKLSVELY